MMNSQAERTKKNVDFKARVPIPRSLDLAENFLGFIRTEAIEDIHYAGTAADAPSDMAMELTVSWKGSINGTLVIRCQREFQAWFLKNRDKNAFNPLTQIITFDEMATLYGVGLIQKFWLSEHFEMGPILAVLSDPSHWPVREPNVTCVLSAGNNPVEIRLWLD